MNFLVLDLRMCIVYNATWCIAAGRLLFEEGMLSTRRESLHQIADDHSKKAHHLLLQAVESLQDTTSLAP